jgi:hypothetical protein
MRSQREGHSMFRQTRTVPPAVYLLADHLDAVLASGEDLVRLRLAVPAQPEEGFRTSLELRRFVEKARALERAASMRALQARRCAREVAMAADQFKSLASLYVSGTVPLQDAVEDLGDASALDFDNADDALGYLRSRGLLDSEAAGLPEDTMLVISDEFLVLGRIALGPLRDLAATFLDVLETHFDLFEDEVAIPAVTKEGAPAEGAPAL